MIAPGTEVRVAAGASKPIRGKLESVTDSSLTVTYKTGTQSFRRPDIQSVSIRKKGHRLRNYIHRPGSGHSGRTRDRRRNSEKLQRHRVRRNQGGRRRHPGTRGRNRCRPHVAFRKVAPGLRAVTKLRRRRRSAAPSCSRRAACRVLAVRRYRQLRPRFAVETIGARCLPPGRVTECHAYSDAAARHQAQSIAGRRHEDRGRLGRGDGDDVVLVKQVGHPETELGPAQPAGSASPCS